MAVPTITHDITIINDASSETGWQDYGANAGKWEVDEDIFIEAAASIALPPKSIGFSGNGFDNGTTFDLSTNIAMVWAWVIAPGYISTKDTWGVLARLGSGATPTTANYNDYLVGGSDVDWVGRGWHLIAIDANVSSSDQNGTFTPATATGIGVGFGITTTTNRSTATAIDAMGYASSYALTASPTTAAADATSFNFVSGSGATPSSITRVAGSWITDGFEDGDTIIVEESENSGENDGIYIVTTAEATILTLFNQLSVTNATDTAAHVAAFVTMEDLVAADVTPYGIIVKNPTGGYDINFPLTIGDGTGTGEVYFLSSGEQIRFADQPIMGGVKILTAQAAGAKTVFRLGKNTGTGQDRTGFAGTIFTQDDFVSGESGSLNLSALIEDCAVDGCTFLELGGGVQFAATSSHFAGYTGTGSNQAALLWEPTTNISYSSFFANTYAIVFNTDTTGSFTLTGHQMAANLYDLHNNSDGQVTASVVAAGDVTTYFNEGTSTTLVLAPTEITLTGMVSASEVRVYDKTSGIEVDGVEDVGPTGEFKFTYGAAEVVYMVIHALEYEYILLDDYTIPATDTELPIEQTFDRNYDNPA